MGEGLVGNIDFGINDSLNLVVGGRGGLGWGLMT